MPPTIVSPADGAEVPAGFTGPVQVTWQEAGEMKVEVSGPQPTETHHTSVVPEDVGSTVEYAISALSAPGAYTIAAGRADGSEPPAQVSVTVSEPPPPANDATILAPANGSTHLVVQRARARSLGRDQRSGPNILGSPRWDARMHLPGNA